MGCVKRIWFLSPMRFGCWLCWGLTSQSTIFQSCRDGAIASWVINQYFRGVKCLAQGHNTAAVGRLWEQWRFRWACTSTQSRQNLRYSLIQAVSQEEPSDRKPDPWPLWMAGHAQLKFVMTECSKTQIRLTQSICRLHFNKIILLWNFILNRSKN